MATSEIKVRFAPSPTGPFHIGGVRTALFNYLFAKQAGGKFLLRIEDTDRERSRPEYEEEIKDSLGWLGLKWDGEIVRQSERLSIYQKHSKELLDRGLAYPSEGSIKFKMPHQKIAFDDLVHGRVEFDSASLDDFVIQKSNGFPTYNFACVVDDHELGITHLIRGDDHLSNTPRQILLYQVFDWKVPSLGHLPLVLGQDGEPLSKRHGEVNLNFYRKSGYLADGIINYLALLGWSSGSNQEFFSRCELVERFSIKQVNKTNATFDVEKLKWLNGEHIHILSDEELVRQGTEYLQMAGEMPATLPKEKVAEIILLFKSRLRIWNDLLWQARFFWVDQVEYDSKAVNDYFCGEDICHLLGEFVKMLELLTSFSDENAIETCLRSCAEKLGVQARTLIHPTRVALTGKSVSPSLFLVMKMMGKPLVLNRLRTAIKLFGAGEQ